MLGYGVVTAQLFCGLSYMSAQFTFLEFYKQAFANFFFTPGKSSTWLTLAAGSCAGIIAVSITYPLDVVRARMAT